MAFYLRKSISFGPLRLNLSKSGLGVSAGVKGLRFGTGPRGNYIHAGRGGIYYRKTLSPEGDKQQPHTQESETGKHSNPHSRNGNLGHSNYMKFESGSVLNMVDGSAADLLRELNEKQRRVRIWPYFGAFLTAFLIGAWYLADASLLIIGCLGLFIATPIIAVWDNHRKVSVLLFDLEPDLEATFRRICEQFENLQKCERIWHVEGKSDTDDPKYHAGAAQVLARSAVSFTDGGPKDIRTNLPIPTMLAGKQRLCFFPDTLLVFEGDRVGAVPYNKLSISAYPTRFIEEDRVPSDATIVDRTWRYVNKRGGPDKRFNDNKELPVVSYDELALASASGLSEWFQFSKSGVADDFKRAITELTSSHQSGSTHNSVLAEPSQIDMPKQPSVRSDGTESLLNPQNPPTTKGEAPPGDQCPCGSGRKYRDCHATINEMTESAKKYLDANIIALQETFDPLQYMMDCAEDRDCFADFNAERLVGFLLIYVGLLVSEKDLSEEEAKIIFDVMEFFEKSRTPNFSDSDQKMQAVAHFMESQRSHDCDLLISLTFQILRFYDGHFGTNYAAALAASIFRFANLVAKADGTVSVQESKTLNEIKDKLCFVETDPDKLLFSIEARPKNSEEFVDGADVQSGKRVTVIKDTTTAEFAKDVLEASMSVPVIVDFWAPWCGPCKELGPILEKAVTERAGAVKLVKLDIETHPDLAQQLRIQSIPAVFAFLRGQPVDGFVGALPESQIKTFIERLIRAGGGEVGPTPTEQMLKQAAEAIATGDVSGAGALYGRILQQQPDNVKAIAGMARCYAETGQPDAATKLLDSLPETKRNDPDVAAVRMSLELAEKSQEAAGRMGESATADEANTKRGAGTKFLDGHSPMPTDRHENISEILNELDNLIGLESVKSEAREIVNFLQVQQIRRERGLPSTAMSNHMVYFGKPGTGKTTVARLIAQAYGTVGLLEKGHLVEADRSALVAGYVGQTAIKTKEMLKKALGGVLFIDEAYMLSDKNGQDYGQESIDTILKFMEDHRDQIIIIVAGYESRMIKFLNSNPGLQSRFNKYLKFSDFSPKELRMIFEKFVQNSHYSCGEKVLSAVEETMTVLSSQKNESFGNARLVRNFFEKSISNQASRIIEIPNPTQKQLMELTVLDLPKAIEMRGME